MNNSPEDLQENISEDEFTVRRNKLQKLRDKGIAFPNDFFPTKFINDCLEQYVENEPVLIAGRILNKRLMGKASFIHIQDMTGKIQIYVRQNDLKEPDYYAEFKNWDLGDIVGIAGEMFTTKTGEKSVKAKEIYLLTKALRPLPDKWHGLQDQELKFRQRYVDLIVTQESRDLFIKRSKIIQVIRDFMLQHKFLEVETPMMHPIAGGAAARPFVTHHNALDMDFYLRIAPELYLKRLVVGGFDRVFEINRNFRNEGVSTRHNPEFTMLEFYQAYANYEQLMDFTEQLMRYIALQVFNSTTIVYQGTIYDLALPFQRLSVIDAILKFAPNLDLNTASDLKALQQYCKQNAIEVDTSWGLGKLQIEVFEKFVETKLDQPTFITKYPTEVSPLARCNDQDPELTDRFEFFIAGKEIANGFSELNDPEDQAMRFKKQAEQKLSGDLEAMHYDADYINALEHGLPPTAGEGFGIDRLVMFFTNQASIRDVLLFPHLRSK